MLIFLAALVLPQIWAWRRGPVTMLGVLGLSLAGVALVSLAQAFGGNGPATHDTYYVISTIHFHLALAVLSVFLMAIVMAAVRTAFPPSIRLIQVLAAGYIASLAVAALGPYLAGIILGGLGRVPEPPLFLLTLVRIAGFAQVAMMICALALAGVAGFSVLRVLQLWSKRK